MVDGVFQLCCCVRMRVGIEGREKARRKEGKKERGGGEEEEDTTAQNIVFCSELRQLEQ